MRLTRQHIRDCAEKAASAFAKFAADLGPNEIFLRDTVYEAGGFPPFPADGNARDAETWKTMEADFIDQWRTRLHRLTHRDPITVHGKGFRLCAPGEVLPTEEAAFFDGIARMGKRFSAKAAVMTTADLSPQERAAATDAMARVGNVAALARRCARRGNS